MNAEDEALRQRMEVMEKEIARMDELKKSEEFLQSILNTTSNNIASYEPLRDIGGSITDFKIIYSNVGNPGRTGIEAPGIIGRTCREIYPGIFKNGIFERLVKCIETGLPDQYQIDYIRDDEVIWYDASIARLNDRVTVTARNITEELKADKQLIDLNRKLKIQNSIFNHSEENADTGSFAWNLTTGELECSDNLYRLIGHRPQEFKPSFEQFISFVHPDDRNQAIRDGIRARETRVLVQNTYRVRTRIGIIKYLRLSGNFIKDEESHLMIGALQDVSKDIQLNEALRIKNIELHRNNEELASFSYVASHDLQEPLRKIRAFSSRILEKEQDNFSEKSKDFFHRIISAATRMQKLIEALLSYSGNNSQAFDFVKTDLNKILEEVKSDLEGNIEEKNARLEIAGLPVISVIPVQFHQLMQNLIGNGIKYSMSERQPVIQVTGSLMPVGESGVCFCKISVRDNGIGFEQRYENRIFDLFQRLHGRNEYEGTGIGLAICKKIVQNHKGSITAESIPGEGSTFHILLPVDPDLVK